MLKRSWLEVNLETIRQNYRIYRSKIPASQEIMAVVKADAYGHGQNRVAAALQDCGCKNFGVSNLDEAILLRNGGVTGQILILGYTPPDAAEMLVKYDITQALVSEEYAELLKDRGIKAHFAIDTGMNRIGLDCDDVDACEAVIRKYQSAYELTGMFTHLCVADTPEEEAFTKGQLQKFKSLAERITDLNLPYIHCMNSAGGLWQAPFGAFARLGIILYGLKPDRANVLPDGIRPAIQWKSVISMVKTVHCGETLGYGRTWKAEKETRVATVATGYADGYNRLLSNKGSVILHGKKAPVIGRVCMDQFMVDVTDVPAAKMGDEVVLLGDGYTADDMAQELGTIGYEVVCNISKRVARMYL